MSDEFSIGILARELGIHGRELEYMSRGALLHDIGKIGIPDQILIKPGPLDEAEWVEMKKHPQFAYDLMNDIDYLKPSVDIPYCHHERWNGSGYPRGLSGTDIPLAARIFSSDRCLGRPMCQAGLQEGLA